jgi:NEDD4-binding protein 2
MLYLRYALYWLRTRLTRKVLVIMRGMPGSGKSTLAEQLAQGGVKLAADDFWGPDYAFDPERRGEAHLWNQARAREEMAKGTTPVVIDNTNVSSYEFKPYLVDAMKHGYKVVFREPDTPWRYTPSVLAERNTHRVPLDVIKEMAGRWERKVSVIGALKSVAPWEK